MSFFDNLWLGFSVASSPMNLLFCLVGVLTGTLIGVLPGIGPLAAVAMLMPITFYLDPVSALVMLAGIYYGSQYGGSTTSILVNLPGESSSVVTCLDGYQMARKGRAGSALAAAALGSFFAGCVVTVLIAIASAPLTSFAFRFRAPDYCALILFGLISSIVLARGSPLKAVAMAFLGILLGTVGTDLNTGQFRYTFGFFDLAEGIGFIAIGMGLFGTCEIIRNLQQREAERSVMARIERLWPTREDFRLSWRPVLRGTGIGAVLGILPGGGALLSSFAAYALEKKVSKTPEKFGTGMIEGVAAPEAANNAGAQASFIPMLALGLPSNALIAMMIGTMMVHGITPGPRVIMDQPELYWGLIASMWIGNLMLVIINLPLIGVWVSLLKVPYRVLYIGIIILCCVGAYSEENAVFTLYLLAVFSVAGFVFIKLNCEPAPLILGFILGPMFEQNLRRSLVLSDGSWGIFVERPISGVFVAVSAVLVAILLLPAIRRKREVAFQED